jgi:hypothetical protein
LPQTSAALDPGGKAMARFWRASRLPGFLVLLSTAVLAYFIAVWLSRSTDSALNRAAQLAPLVVDGTAAVLAFRQLRRYKSSAAAPLRQMTLLFCLALLTNCVGSVIWLVYNLLGVAVPYPSYADIFWVATDLIWILGIGLLFWALDTNLRDELGPFVDILAVTWSLTIVVISLVGVSAETVGNLLKLVLDIIYPFLSALACALLGAVLFGPQLRRLSPRWRWFLAALYLSWLLTFISDIGFSITSSLGHGSNSLEYFYYDGGPTDFIIGLGDLVVCWALAFIPLQDELKEVLEDRPGDFVGHHLRDEVTGTTRPSGPSE